MGREVAMLSETIRRRMLEAMKAGNTLERDILKVALGEIQATAVRKGADLDDAEAVAVLRKLAKSNQESLALVQDAAKQERLEAEITVLESLLPRTLDVDAIVRALEEVSDAIVDAKADGPATGIAMKHLKTAGAAVEGKDVAAAVRRMRG